MDGTLRIVSGDSFINGFYNNFLSNIELYFSSNPDAIVNGVRKIFTDVFQGTLSASEYEAIIAASLNKPIYNNPYVSFVLSNIKDDDFVNLVTTGTTPNTPASQANKNLVAQVATQGKSTLKNNYDASIKFIRDNQFSCTFSYPGYARGQFFQFDFSKTVDPSSIGACLGLVAFVDESDINKGDAKIVSNFIKSYSNTTTFISSNLYSANVQKNAAGYYKIFEGKFQESVDKFIKDESANLSNRTGASNAPVTAPTRPQLDESFIIRNDDEIISASEVGPSGVTLNQFTQPNFNEILSILDIIRDRDTNEHIKENQSDITIDGGDGDTVSTVIGTTLQEQRTFTFQNGVLPFLKTDEKNSAKNALQENINGLKKNIEELTISINKICKTDEFILTCIVAGIGSAGDADKKPNTETLRDNYSKLSRALKNEADENGQTASANAKIQQASWNDVKNLNEKFRVRLEIFAPTNDQISQNTIKTIYKETNDNPPAELNTIVSLTNKSNTQEVNKNIQSIVQKVADNIKSTEGQKIKFQNQIDKYQKLLDEFK